MKMIAIIGGAGPAAGVELTRLIVDACQQRGCKEDSDYPRIVLWSEPFIDMLRSPEPARVTTHLDEAINRLQDLGADAIGIACNTLHGFLTEPLPGKLVSLITIGAEETRRGGWRSPVILASHTSCQRRTHTPLATGSKWPTDSDQSIVDEVITAVLAGDLSKKQWEKLVRVVRSTAVHTTDAVVMGCTELSLLRGRWCPNSKIASWAVIDPLLALAQALVEEVFKPLIAP